MIEALWYAIRRTGYEAQRRVDAAHPLDLYADYRFPERPGLVLFTKQRPPTPVQARSITIETGKRPDGRWSVRLTLEAPALYPVFRELCHDIVKALRTGVSDERAAAAFLERLERWRRLLERGANGFSEEKARGLIAELIVFRRIVLPEFGPEVAVESWTGPRGMPQDFTLAGRQRLEVKATQRDPRTIRINGLHQLDPGPDTLTLLAVGMERSTRDATGSISVQGLVDLIRQELEGAPAATDAFEDLLTLTGWSPEAEPSPCFVRPQDIRGFAVTEDFPRLTAETVPPGIIEASYEVQLGTPSWIEDAT